MAIDVAVLRAKLRFEAEGANQAVQEAQKVEQAVRGVERAVSSQMRSLAGAEETISRAVAMAAEAAASTSASVRQSGDDITNAVQGYQEFVTKIEMAEARLAELGATMSTASQVSQQYTDRADAAAAASARYGEMASALEADIKRLWSVEEQISAKRAGTYEKASAEIERMREQVRGLRRDEEAAKAESSSLRGQGQEVANLAEVLGSAALLQEANKRLADVEKTTVRVSKATGVAAQTTSVFTRVLGQFNNGSGLTISNLASMAARLTGLGVGAVVVVRGFQKLVRSFMEGSRVIDAFTRSSPEVVDMVKNLENLGNVNLGALVGQLDDIRIRLSNLGAVDLQIATEQVAKIAVDIQYLNTTPDDLQVALQSVQRTVETLDFSNLKGFDLGANEITDLNTKFRELANDGMSKAQLQYLALIELERIRAANAGKSAQQQAKEESTLANTLGAVGTAFMKGVADSEPFRLSVARVVEVLRDAQPVIEVVARTLADTLGLTVQALTAVVDGLRVAWHGLMVGLASIGSFAGDLLGFDTSGLDDFIQKNEAAINQIDKLRRIQDEYGPNDSAFQKVADVTTALAQDGDLTLDFFRDLQRTAAATDAEMVDSLTAVISAADAYGLAGDQVEIMQKALRGYKESVAAADSETSRFIPTLEDFKREVKAIQDEVRQGQGLASQVQALGDAWVAMQEDMNPRTAMAGLNQFSTIIDTVIEDGIGSIEAFRLRAQAAFDLGFFNEAEFAAVNENFDNMEQILGPIAVKAQELREEQERLAAAKLSALTGEMINVQSETSTATGEFVNLINTVAQADAMTVDIPINFSVGSMPFTDILNAATGQVPGPVTPTTTTATPQRNTALSRQERRNFKESVESSSSLAREAAARTEAEKADFRNALGIQGGFGRGGGGGGGGGADSNLATVEQLRALFTEVNRAISIAANGGVRIGTAGNAIPFEEGTFLNTQGGGMSIDTILIRGVWDFADPAAKRQIIRELKEALAGLEGEI